MSANEQEGKVLYAVVIQYRAKDIAAWAGVGESTVYDWMKGNRLPSALSLLRLLTNGPVCLQEKLLRIFASCTQRWMIEHAGEFELADLDVDRDGDVDSDDEFLQSTVVAERATLNIGETHRRLEKLDEQAHVDGLRNGSQVTTEIKRQNAIRRYRRENEKRRPALNRQRFAVAV